MDIATASTATATASVKTPEAETEAPTRIQPSKPLSFTNGVLKRHHHHHHHRHHRLNPPLVVVTYKQCLKNHAASLGGHALDGCGEFMPSPTADPTDPTSLKCAACGCHRNFHRREPEEPLPAQHVIEYQPHHRHHPPPPPPPPPPRGGHSSPNSASPPPISSSYYPSAPHMLLALSAGLPGPPPENNPSMTATAGTPAANSNGRKRFRTKFTQDQKEKMQEFAERVGWKMQKRDEELIAEFCSEVGVDKGVFKVWMHNNKSTFLKRDVNTNTNTNTNTNNGNGNGIVIGNRNTSTLLDNTPTHYHHHENHDNNNSNNNHHHHHQNFSHHHHQNNDSVSTHVVATNGSSSSS